jgi:hypothetical protein
MAGPISLSHAASDSFPIPKNSAMNRSTPGAKMGMLKVMTETTAHIDAATYPLSRGVIVETQSGVSLAQSPGWQKRLAYPIFVQYWVEKTGITQMIVFLKNKSANRE